MTPVRNAWFEPRILIQIAAYIAGLGVLMSQVRTNSEAIARVIVIVERLEERQRQDERWRDRHEEYEKGEGLRIRDEIARERRENGPAR